ncbi:HPF/RaiA family ribosome-associated protein [Chthonobacter rhizosphaerae]|uniref:HPF/RaiA family ribosome-associated protein n=1 Tax=Chthonobacter rhizosphaerae TaxID=2735553 RepID=UPI0015EED160|nr:HPF/RaiA family ribosome-associated protein [Chthonobacter rhizosphaerae]
MDVPLQIAFKNLESSEFLETLIRERVARLERYHDHIVGCRVLVEVPYRAPAGGKVPIGISVEVEVPGAKSIVAKDQEERHDSKNDHTAVVNRTFDKVQRQLEDHSSIRRGEVKVHESDGTTGRIVRLFPDQNYGFIEVAGSPDLYFTRNAVVSGSYDDLAVGESVRVTVATTEGPMGPQASSVRRIGQEAELR